jgi:hypothetical protein
MEWLGWQRTSFCISAMDEVGSESRIVFVIDPDRAMENWTFGRFNDLAEWGRKGFPGVFYTSGGLFWILSPNNKGA